MWCFWAKSFKADRERLGEIKKASNKQPTIDVLPNSQNWYYKKIIVISRRSSIYVLLIKCDLRTEHFSETLFMFEELSLPTASCCCHLKNQTQLNLSMVYQYNVGLSQGEQHLNRTPLCSCSGANNISLTLTTQSGKSKHSFLVYNMIPCSWCSKFLQLVKKQLSALQNAPSHWLQGFTPIIVQRLWTL